MKKILSLFIAVLTMIVISCKKEINENAEKIETYNYCYVNGIKYNNKYGENRTYYLSNIQNDPPLSIINFFNFTNFTNNSDIIYKDFFDSILNKKLFYYDSISLYVNKHYQLFNYEYFVAFPYMQYSCEGSCSITNFFGQSFSETVSSSTIFQDFQVKRNDYESYLILDRYEKILDFQDENYNRVRSIYLIEGRYNAKISESIYGGYYNEFLMENGKYKQLIII